MGKKTNNADSSYASKYPPNVQGKGFSQVPNCLILCHHELDLTTPELTALLVLHAHDFGTKEVTLAHSTLARHLGRGKTTAQSSIQSLKTKGFINVKPQTGQSNTYDMLPLVQKLSSHPCINPINKPVAPSQKSGMLPYRKTDTKEYSLKRQFNKTGGTESIKDLIAHRKKAYGQR